MEYRIVTPKEGFRLRMPENQYQVLPEEGQRVGWPGPANYWSRAEARGEITSAPDEEAPEEGKAKEAAKKPEEVAAKKAPDVRQARAQPHDPQAHG